MNSPISFLVSFLCKTRQTPDQCTSLPRWLSLQFFLVRTFVCRCFHSHGHSNLTVYFHIYRFWSVLSPVMLWMRSSCTNLDISFPGRTYVMTIQTIFRAHISNRRVRLVRRAQRGTQDFQGYPESKGLKRVIELKHSRWYFELSAPAPGPRNGTLFCLLPALS